ncbi:hypothetical protein NUW58_g4228 [Xylaria curta]|uniref:Uncharacterized protein n=1 Tax=Xylaria curta TaxID=42375 RepID=A0ACC1P8U5_9PEZI|nr:hypothetical protein NUW58_g4228 [Xylaria curta]
MSRPEKKAGPTAATPSHGRMSLSPTPSNSSGTVVSAAITVPVDSVHEQASSTSEGQSSARSPSQGTDARGPKSFAHPAFKDIGDKLKECNNTLADMQLLGVTQYVAAFPELVLEYEYRPPANRGAKQINMVGGNPFPHWVLKSPEKIVFKTIYEHDSTSIDEVLRWAQIATLNPSQNPEQFIPGEGNYAKEKTLETAKQSTETKFSPNLVSLVMKGPGFRDLSFFDLPGIFATTEAKDDGYLVDVVENLTRKYVRRKGALIMLALPMDQDIENSRTLKLIRDLDAENRTIGVLTKADRPNFKIPDTIAYWLAVLDERKQRCGVDQLRSHITKELGTAFAQSIPGIKKIFKDRLQEVKVCLKTLPGVPGNVEHEVRMSLRDFYTSVKRAIEDQDFEQGCKQLTEEFFARLLELKPKCNMLTESPIPRRKEIVEVSDDSEKDVTGSKRFAPKDLVIGSTPKRQRRNELITTPVKAEEFSAGGAFQSPATRSFKDREPMFSLLGIKKQIKLTTRGGFADIVPLQVHETFCLKAVAQWEMPLRVYIDKAITMLIAAVNRALESSLKSFGKRLIYKESCEYVAAHLDDVGVRQRERLSELYENETYKAVTFNELGLNHFEAQEKELLERHRLFIRAKAAGFIDPDEQIKRDEQMSREEKLEQSRLLDKYQAQMPEELMLVHAFKHPKEFKREINVAAKVRAYYLTAATRFVDVVSMDINSRLFRSIRDGALDDFLEKKLGLFPYPSPEAYERLMEEDTATAQEREQLWKEQKKLETALEKLLKLERSLEGYTIPCQHDFRPTTHTDETLEYNGKTEM